MSTDAVATAIDEASAAIRALGKRIDSTYGVGKGADASLLEQALEQQHHSRTVAMLKVLADTLEHEYTKGGKSHWGSEDRRTKMLFISLDRGLMNGIIAVIITNVVTVCFGAIYSHIQSEAAQ
jgi:hypothetical protein